MPFNGSEYQTVPNQSSPQWRSFKRMSIEVDKFISQTRQLTAAQIGALFRLLVHFWERGSIPQDDAALSRITGFDHGHWKRYGRPALIESGLINSMTQDLLASYSRIEKKYSNINAKKTHTDGKEENIERSKKESKKDSACEPNGSGRYFFEFGIIRLTEAAFKKWEDVFQNIDVRAELVAAEPWLSQKPNWYMAAGGLLGKRNREIGVRTKVISDSGSAVTGEPEVVRQGRRNGEYVEKLQESLPRWKVGTWIYDDQGREVGF